MMVPMKTDGFHGLSLNTFSLTTFPNTPYNLPSARTSDPAWHRGPQMAISSHKWLTASFVSSVWGMAQETVSKLKTYLCKQTNKQTNKKCISAKESNQGTCYQAMVVFVPFPHWQVAGGKSNSTASDMSAWPKDMGEKRVGEYGGRVETPREGRCKHWLWSQILGFYLSFAPFVELQKPTGSFHLPQ